MSSLPDSFSRVTYSSIRKTLALIKFSHSMTTAIHDDECWLRFCSWTSFQRHVKPQGLTSSHFTQNIYSRSKAFLIITSLRFPCPILAICLSIFLASSTLRSWGMGTTGPLGLEQHLLSQLARGVRNCVAPMMSMQQWSPNSKSWKRKLVFREKAWEERLALEERKEKAINGSIRIKAYKASPSSAQPLLHPLKVKTFTA